MSDTAKKGGRKATELVEITDREFTVSDLAKANPSVMLPTVRGFVGRKVESGVYVPVATVKTGLRGKPATSYKLAKV